MSPPRDSLEKALELHRAGRVSQADELCREILRIDPNHAEALHLLGLILLGGGEGEQAVSLFYRACELHPDVAKYHLSHARALRFLHQMDAAQHALERALVRQPDLAEAHELLGNMYKAQHRYAEAITCLHEAARLVPKNAVVWLNLGVAYLETAQADHALASFHRAVELAPERPDAWNILGHALFTFGHATEARQKFEHALKLKPSYSAAHDNLGRVARAQGKPSEALREFRAAVATDHRTATQSNLLFALNFVPGMPPAEIAAEHFYWGAAHSTSRPVSWVEHDFTPARKLRVGFVSPDFVHHAVSYFFEPLLQERPRNDWEVFCYSAAVHPDHVTRRLESRCDWWRDISTLNDDAAESVVREDRIDILIDLAGHSANNRLPLFARRPAPLQFTWLGYPNTTGLQTIDGRITDLVTDPVGQTEAFYSEKLVRLPRAFSCYLPPAESPPVSPLPAAENGSITFGSFNQLAKVNAEVVTCWSAVLRAVPHSRLFLRSAVLSDRGTADDLRQRFAAHGVAAHQLLLSGEQLSVEDHLRAYSQMDIALDPFPYNGTTTTCEALWMGVPVVTLQGATHVSRVGTSLLTHLGAAEWIANSESSYVATAQRLAQDLSALASIRSSLRGRMAHSALCDSEGFAEEFAYALRQRWMERCRMSLG